MKIITELRSMVSPYWNQILARDRLKRFLRELEKRSIVPDVVVYDIGARWGISPPLNKLLGIGKTTTVGFDADQEEAERLRAARSFDIVAARALGAKAETRQLHLARDPGSSTIFPPDMQEIGRHTTSRQFETVRSIDIRVDPLDDVVEQENLPLPDIIKIDCEGAEGEILEGAKRTLDHVCAVQFEARFAEFYKGGATFCPLVQSFFDKGFICLHLDPRGAFFGAFMMFDVLMVRHPDSLKNQRQFINYILICLIYGKWPYAERAAFLRGKDFGFPDLAGLMKR